MGNTPLHSKRRLSGEIESISFDNTPPHFSMDIPAKRPTPDFPHSAPLQTDFGGPDVDNMAWLLHGASIQDGAYPARSVPVSSEVSPISFPVPLSSTIGDVAESPAVDDLPSDIEMVPKSREDGSSTKPLLPTVFKWNSGGHEIYISGTFNNWQERIPMARHNSGACVIVDCPPGKHEYKFFIDGAWYHDPNQMVVSNQYGTKNNVVEVKESDFNFLNALEQDIANSKHKPNSVGGDSDTGSRTSPDDDNGYGRFIPETPKDVYPPKINGSNFVAPVHRRNTQGTQPPAPGVGSITQPPHIPPQLLQGILNKDVGVHCDPNLLPQPNHVVVNHLYALSIKDGVIVLSVITRYRQKFVSTLFYKPIPN